MTFEDELAAVRDSPPISATTTNVDGAGLDGAVLLDDVYATITSYVIWPTEAAAIAYTLWIAATHAQPVWEHATRFVVKSPIKRCGKTRAQEVGRELVNQPLSTTNISVAALVRSIEEESPPTLILDEADSIFGRKGKDTREGAEDLRGILNSGHSKGWPYIRWDPASRRREECVTFAMALVGGIGDMPDTIEDRAVVVSMRRRAPGEPVRQFRRRRALPRLHELRDQLHAWMSTRLTELEHAEPDLPVEDREADVWESLVAVADIAGGEWPARARDACRDLCGAATLDEGTLGERLLADIQAIWRDDEEHLFTTTILERLNDVDEAPWKEGWGTAPRPLSARSLAALLRPYRVASRTVRIGDDTAKGYARADLADLWCRYVTADTPSQKDKTSDLSSDNGRDGRVTKADFGSVTAADHPKHANRDVVTVVTGEGLERAYASPDGDVAARERELLASIDPEDPDHGVKVALARAAARLPHQPQSATDKIDVVAHADHGAELEQQPLSNQAVAAIGRALASVRETQ